MMFPLPLFAMAVPLQAFSDSDPFGKFIVLIQIGMSIASWGIMSARFRSIHAIRERANKFVNDFSRENDPLALIYNRYDFDKGDPLERIYQCTCKRFLDLIPERQRLLLQADPAASIQLSNARMELVETACRHSVNEERAIISKGMTLLATITSSAPLFGLFGTVWGIMLAFAAMATSGSANIAELAPGISSALLTTVVGLVVAIPSTIAYNMLHRSIEVETITQEDFADELMGKLILHYQTNAEGR